MFTTLTVIASAICGALAFRLRGDTLFNDWTRTGTIGGRAFFALVMAGIAIAASWAAGSVDCWLLPLPPAWFACCVAGWSTGTESGQVVWWRVMGRGVLWVLPAALVLVGIEDLGAVEAFMHQRSRVRHNMRPTIFQPHPGHVPFRLVPLKFVQLGAAGLVQPRRRQHQQPNARAKGQPQAAGSAPDG